MISFYWLSVIIIAYKYQNLELTSLLFPSIKKENLLFSVCSRENIKMVGKGKSLGSTSAKKYRSRSTKAGLHFPVGRISQLLKVGKYAEHVGAEAPVFLAAVLSTLQLR